MELGIGHAADLLNQTRVMRPAETVFGGNKALICNG